MTSETSYERAGYCLEYLQFLRSEMDGLASLLGLDIQWMIDRLCTFSCESDFSKFNKDYSMNENWTQLLSVYHNLLSRGVPTYPTFQIEEFLTSEVSKVIPIEESGDERIIAFRDQLTGVQKEEWLKVLVQAYAAIDYRCDSLMATLKHRMIDCNQCLEIPGSLRSRCWTSTNPPSPFNLSCSKASSIDKAGQSSASEPNSSLNRKQPSMISTEFPMP